MKLTDLTIEQQQQVQYTRELVASLHAELPKNNLVVWTAGNISQKIEGLDLFVIKPSGVSYSELEADNMVVCTLDGEKIEDNTADHLQPSSDTAAHAYVYRHLPQVGGVVHTHSPYATAFAAVGKEIPCVLTMCADEFGGPVPVGPLAIIGDDSIGKGIVETLRSSRSPAVLMQQHGPFTIGKNAKEAVKAAIMVEEIAKTIILAKQLGDIKELPIEMIDRLWDRYQNIYGQKTN